MRILVVLVSCFFVLTTMLAPSSGFAVDADDVSFDDSATTVIGGTDVQAGLESADSALANLNSTAVTFDDSTTTVIGGTDVQAALESADSAMANFNSTTVPFDDSATTVIEGADVQAALESADSALDPFYSVDPNANVVFLRNDCTAVPNCFTSMVTLAGTSSGAPPVHPSTETNNAWLWTTRQPTAADPVMVQIGPGTFDPFVCPSNLSGARFGHVTLRGSGRDSTKLKGTLLGVDVMNCESLAFSDLRSEGDSYGVRWIDGGSATWTDVDAHAEGGSGLGWLDFCLFGQDISLHYFFGSRVSGKTTSNNQPDLRATYTARCSETWFFGGEIKTESEPSGSLSVAAIYVEGSDFRAFGSAIRVEGIGNDGLPVADFIGVHVQNGGQFHMHGGIVSVRTSSLAGTSTTSNAIGVFVEAGGSAHTPGTAWVLAAPDGAATRVSTSTGGTAQVPFLWPSGTDEPVAGLQTQTGSDVFVETDCNNATGVCDGSGTTRPHMMIYDASCTPTPWFDSTAGACRQP